MYSNLPLYKFTLHYLAIPTVWFIIFSIVSTYNYYITYNNDALNSTPLLKKFLSLIFYICASMTIICHTMAMYSDPGILNYTLVDKLKKDKIEFCKKCNKHRPLRAHHCSTCDRCIMKMDHHCPWIFNCVGYGNQKIFFLFLSYSTTGCGLAFFVLLSRFFTKDFLYMLRYPKFNVDFNQNFFVILGQTFFALSEPLTLLIGTALSLSMTLAIGGLLINQIYLISRNTTGVESSIYEDDWEQNPWYANKQRWFMFKTVLGLNSKWKWFLPIVESNKYNSGYEYDTPYRRIVPPKKKKEDKKGCCCGICCC